MAVDPVAQDVGQQAGLAAMEKLTSPVGLSHILPGRKLEASARPSLRDPARLLPPIPQVLVEVSVAPHPLIVDKPPQYVEAIMDSLT